MLNITNNSIKSHIDVNSFESFKAISQPAVYNQINRWLVFSLLSFIVFAFLPWTQNIKSDGALTTLEPGKRPQTIVSVVPGRIEQWFVTEGDRVIKGDTIAILSETKDLYFDPELVRRTRTQIEAKEAAVEAYQSKVEALEDQISALGRLQKVKLESLVIKQSQLRLYIASDSADLAAYQFGAQVADKQANRTNQLLKDGLKSLTDFEIKDVKRQETQAGQLSKENKLMAQRQELENIKLSVTQTEQEFREKISKAQSDKFTAITNLNDAISEIQKLQTNLANYEIRRENLVIMAPQNGIVSRINRAGLGEMIKDGEQIAVLLPDDFSIAAAIYVKPMDLPLIEKGQSVRLIFDGWPALVFSGWPDVSFGSYSGTVSMIESQTSTNGYYRVLVTPDPLAAKWPSQLQLGSGVHGMSLLNDVPIWYEIWRQINGFPPSFYKENGEKSAQLIDENESKQKKS